MIITKRWLQEYIDIRKFSTQQICDVLNSIGLEVDSTQRILIPNNVVIGKVEDCQKHPDADKLNICQVNIGSKVEQIVCGASNVASGQFVAVATVGAVLGEDFTIKKATLRGVESCGMICSSTELGLPKINDGIMVLDDSIGELVLGKELNEYGVINDEIIEIELTANRGDCLSINGVARELSTYFGISMKNVDPIVVTNNKGIGQVFDVLYDTNCQSSLIYKAANIENFSLKLLHKLRAATIGKLQETDIETAIAYATHSTGVLINVYSKAATYTQNNDLVSLRVLQDEDGFDTVQGDQLLSIIGVDGGKVSNICDEVLIEASYIDPNFLSQQVFQKKKKTSEIYYRASRGSEPNLEVGIDAIVSLLSLNGGTVYNGSRNFINDVALKTINVNNNQLNKIIGQDVEPSKVSQILTSLGFFVKQDGQDTINVTIPSFRHDVQNIADITEEIVRIIGIDKIVSKPLLIQEMNSYNESSNSLQMLRELRTRAISNGFFETITYIFSNKELLEKYNFPTVVNKKDILNPIVNELNTFRTTLSLNLVQAVAHNVKQGFRSVGLFETGVVFDKNRTETKKIGFIFSGEQETPSIKNSAKPQNIDLFGFGEKIANILGEFELQPMKKIISDFVHPYQNANIMKNGKNIGILYKLHPTVADDFDISKETFIAQVNVDAIKKETIFATNVSKFQASRRDLSIITPKQIEYKEIKKVIKSLKIKEIKQFNLVDIYSDEKLKSDESLTIRFILQSETKTFEESDINTIMEKILKKLQDELGIGLR